jgi:hypothetical protein
MLAATHVPVPVLDSSAVCTAAVPWSRAVQEWKRRVAIMVEEKRRAGELV